MTRAVTATMNEDKNLPDPLAAVATGRLSAPAVSDERLKTVMAASAPASTRILMPRELAEQIDGINQWANANRREAKWESFWFWALKVPVIVATAGYGLLAKYDNYNGLAWAGAISAACVRRCRHTSRRQPRAPGSLPRPSSVDSQKKKHA